jgi:hypothetical protein
MKQNQKQNAGNLFKPKTGTTLAVTAGLSFFVLCMILPLVGPAGSRVEHAGKNQAAFILVLMITLALAGLSAYSKLGRRKIDGSPLPIFSIGLCAVCVLTFIVLLLGGFAI